MDVWQGVAMDSLKYCLGPPCPTLLQATPETALRPFQGGQPASTHLDSPRRTSISMPQHIFKFALAIFSLETWVNISILVYSMIRGC